ncbi:hypothetical protein ACMZ79_03365 [Gardnerella vaginalis]|uniref:hypothetical protein n=1 Tax=Gardnerella vaginalis TaxID=2702 RepID=UPI0039F0385D
MNMQKIYYDMAEKLRPYAEPYMSEFSKEFANDAIGAGEPYEALADYLSFAWEHQNTPRELIIEAYNLIDDDYLDSYNEMADKLGIPRRKHSADYDEDE